MACERTRRAITTEQVSAGASGSPVLDWQTVDRELQSIRQRRAALDAEEAYWLRQAESLQIWSPLGMVDALDYLERVLGYSPRSAHERLRVARALGGLPQLSAALASGELSFSGVRELTRVVTPSTEGSWIAAATGKNLRQIEDLVAEHRQGDLPGDPPDPTVRRHVVRLELSAETFALLRQTRTVINDEHGQNLPDDAFVAALCSAVLDGGPAAEPTGRAKFQVAVTVCQRCRQGWQDGAGARIPVDPAAVDRAMCDAQHIGSIDGERPERAYQDIAPSVARLVWRRDHGRCRVDGCRSARGLELHHIVHREAGGSHDASNLVLICSACHQSHHAGVLAISGTADHLDVRRPGHAAPIAGTRPGSPGRVAAAGTRSAVEETTSADLAGAHADRIVPVEGSAHAGTDRRNIAGAEDHNDAGTNRPIRVAERAHVGADGRNLAVAEEGADAGAKHPIGVAEHAHVGAAWSKNAAVADRPHTGPVPGPSSCTVVGTHRNLARKLDAAILRTQAKAALTGLGWKSAIAHAAVAAAAQAQGTEVTLEQLIVASLQRCPIPR